MFKLELHIVAKADNQEILERVTERLRFMLEWYSKENKYSIFGYSKLDEFEIGGGVTEVSSVQNDTEILPD